VVCCRYRLLRQVLWLAAIVLLALRDAAFYQVVVARLLCGVLEAFVFFKLSYRRGFLSGPRRFDWSEAQRLLQYGYPMVLSAIARAFFFGLIRSCSIKWSAPGPSVPMLSRFSSPSSLARFPWPHHLARTCACGERRPGSALPELSQQSYRFLTAVVFFVCAVITPITRPVIAFCTGRSLCRRQI